MSRSRAPHIGAVLSLFAVVLLLAGPGQALAAPPSASTPSAITPGAVAPYLDTVLSSVDAYWHETLAAAGRPSPSVHHVWVAPGAQTTTACGMPAGDTAAFYCATDDTIYVGQAFAGAIYDGVFKGLPGQQAGFGKAAGAFAVAYIVAHEYGHNVQQENGTLAGRTRALPVELNADCLAGTWSQWEYGHGRLTDGDVQQALDAALAVGDFEFLSPQHHGTPQERRDAVLTGFRGANPSACDQYLALP